MLFNHLNLVCSVKGKSEIDRDLWRAPDNNGLSSILDENALVLAITTLDLWHKVKGESDSTSVSHDSPYRPDIVISSVHLMTL